MVFPNGILLLGYRSYISCLGILCIIIGQWQADQIWDDTTANSTNSNTEEDGDEQQQQQQQRKKNTNGTDTTNTNDSNTISVAAREMMDSAQEYMDTTYRAMSDPNSIEYHSINTVLYRNHRTSGYYIMLANIGWILLSISFLLECHTMNVPNVWHINIITILHFMIGIIIGIIQSILLPYAIRKRTVHVHVHFFTLGSLLCFILLSLLLILHHNDAPIYMPIVATIAITIGPNILWYCRKRGDIYDRTNGELYTLRPVLYNIGGPIYITGWFIFWIAMNYVNVHDDMLLPNSHFTYIPIYFTSRTAVAFEGVLTIFAAYWATGYAYDEYDDPETIAAIETIQRRTGGQTTTIPRPLKAFYFGRILESRIFFVIAYCMISICIFLPYFHMNDDGGIIIICKLLLFICIILQGFAVGVQHVLGIRIGDTMKLHKWTRAIQIIYGIIIFLSFISFGYYSGILILLGVLLQGIGWYRLLQDRKRGTYWIQHNIINPKYTVYSYGVLLFPLGLLLFAWGLSIP